MNPAKEDTQSCCESEEPQKKPGFFERMFNKLDEKVKAKAEEQQSKGCCGGDDGKGGGCGC